MFNSPPSVIDDHGDIQHSQYPPTYLELSSIRHWNDSVSWVQFVFQGLNGKLTDSSQGLGQEELLIFQTPLRNASTLLVCAFNITQVTVSTPVALLHSNSAKIFRRLEMPRENRDGSIFPMD